MAEPFRSTREPGATREARTRCLLARWRGHSDQAPRPATPLPHPLLGSCACRLASGTGYAPGLRSYTNAAGHPDCLAHTGGEREAITLFARTPASGWILVDQPAIGDLATSLASLTGHRVPPPHHGLSTRQNALAAALKVRRTIYAARYLPDPDYRHKISAGPPKAGRYTRSNVTSSTPTTGLAEECGSLAQPRDRRGVGCTRFDSYRRPQSSSSVHSPDPNSSAVLASQAREFQRPLKLRPPRPLDTGTPFSVIRISAPFRSVRFNGDWDVGDWGLTRGVPMQSKIYSFVTIYHSARSGPAGAERCTRSRGQR